jgi:tetratricopeptide (TPR) repeat protein
MEVVDASDVGAALARILANPSFVRSPRLADFLRYVVEQRLAGRNDGPKEVEIGVQVFGKTSDYDPRIDPVVRVQARLLRFKLHEYYETAGKSDLIRIDLPKGSYLPVFTGLAGIQPGPVEPAPVDPTAAVSAQPDRAAPGTRFPNPRWAMAAGLLGVLLTIGFSVNSWREAIGKVWAKTLPNRPQEAESASADLYLQGRYYWNKRTPEDLRTAVDYFTQSIVADPGYAKAYVGLADCYGLLREFAAMPEREAWPRALAAARKAVELDDSLAEAHSTLGFDLFYGEFDLKGGEREFKRAVELNPNYAEGRLWYATSLMSVGRLREASEEMERARELNPASRAILCDQGLLLYYEGMRDQALEQLRQVAAAEPAFRSAHAYLSYIYYVARDGANRLLESRKAAESSHSASELAVVAAAEKGFASGGWQGMLQSELVEEKKLEQAGSYPAYNVAQTSALLGRKEEALRYLEASYRKREVNFVAVSMDATFESLRGEPSYLHLLAQLGLDGAN